MQVLSVEKSRRHDQLKSIALRAKKELYPRENKIWWEPLPIANYVLESYRIIQDGKIISTEIYHHRANGSRYARIYLNPAEANMEYIPTLVIGGEKDLNRIARRDGSESFDLDLNDGISLPNISVNLTPEEIKLIPGIDDVLLHEVRLQALGRKSSFVLTGVRHSTDSKHIYKMYENLLKPFSQESFIHVMKNDESPITDEVGGIMITNSKDYVNKVYLNRTKK